MKSNIVLVISFLVLMTSCTKKGCNSSSACNYDEKAGENDGSCYYCFENDCDTYPENGYDCSGNFTGVVDIDGNQYMTKTWGRYSDRTGEYMSQRWMMENLKVTHYRNGDEIPTGFVSDDWYELKGSEVGAYTVLSFPEGEECGHNSSSSSGCSDCDAYGNYYNWFAVDDSRGLCPEGWHVPTYKEWFDNFTSYFTWNATYEYYEVEKKVIENRLAAKNHLLH